MSQIDDVFADGFEFASATEGVATEGEQLSSNSEESSTLSTEEQTSVETPTAPEPLEAQQEVGAHTEPAPTESAQSEFADEEALRQKIVELSTELTQLKNAQMGQPTPTPSLPEGTKLPEAGAITNVDFLQGLTDDSYIAMLESPEQFNKVLNTVATTAYIAATNAAQESLMRRIPEIVSNSVNQQKYIHGTTDKFYEQNPDLTAYKSAVAMAAIQLFNEQPNLSLPDLLQQAGSRTREMLRIKPNSQRKRMPAQPAGSSVTGGLDRASSAPALTDQERQILDLLRD